MTKKTYKAQVWVGEYQQEADEMRVKATSRDDAIDRLTKRIMKNTLPSRSAAQRIQFGNVQPTT
jgi:hypothetical protein